VAPSKYSSTMSLPKRPIYRDGELLWACSKCEEPKLPREFHKNVSRANGLYPYCVVCQRAIAKKAYHAKKRKLAKKK
jgi:hypothetical protein